MGVTEMVREMKKFVPFRSFILSSLLCASVAGGYKGNGLSYA